MAALSRPLAPLLALGLGLLLGSGPAQAQDALPGDLVQRAQEAELERVRAEVAGQIQLAAYDLVDELVYGWTRDPVFEQTTPVVLAEVTVPVGLGTGLQALLENHVNAVVSANPSTNLQLVHCPRCTAVVVHSGPTGTVISRGVDNPAALAELGESTGKHALFLDIEAEGTSLVLRARLTRLTEDLPIVWSHTLSSSASAPSLLREAADLKSASEAREEYLRTLRGQGPITIPLRFTVRTYARPEVSFTNQGIAPPPFLWLQSGVELGSTNANAWTSSLLLGYSFVPQAYQGLMAQARVNRLMTGRVRSLTRPDLYGFVGAAIMTMWGPATASFRDEALTLDEVLTDMELGDPRTTVGALHIGADLRLGRRVGFSSFLETMPILANSDNLGNYVFFAGINFQSLGTEVTFCF